MSDHDPICERRLKAYGTYRCTCDEIREARAEEHERITQDEEIRLGNAYNAGWRAACERTALAREGLSGC